LTQIDASAVEPPAVQIIFVLCSAGNGGVAAFVPSATIRNALKHLGRRVEDLAAAAKEARGIPPSNEMGHRHNDPAEHLTLCGQQHRHTHLTLVPHG
jgi:hypothetical protein